MVIPKVRSPKSWGWRETICTAICYTVVIVATSTHKQIGACLAGMLSLGLASIENGGLVEPIQIHYQLTEMYGESCMDVKSVRKWCREFRTGRTEIHYEQRSGRPSISDETVAKVKALLHEKRRITLDDVCVLVPEVVRITIHRILTKKWKLTVFWDRKRILLVEYMPAGTTINADRYYETLEQFRTGEEEY